jgi:transcriptional regulator with XRE-family HTH domain
MTGLSLRGLAQHCAVDPATLVRLRQGEMKFPSDDVLECIARKLSQDPDDYRLALLADRGELPSWGKVLGSELGVRLSTEDEQAIRQFVEAMLRGRRGS